MNLLMKNIFKTLKEFSLAKKIKIVIAFSYYILLILLTFLPLEIKAYWQIFLNVLPIMLFPKELYNSLFLVNPVDVKAFDLLKRFHKRYQVEVIGQEQSMEVFKRECLDDIKAMGIKAKYVNKRAILKIISIFDLRFDLAIKYLSSATFSFQSYHKLIREYNRTILDSKEKQCGLSPRQQLIIFNSLFNTCQIEDNSSQKALFITRLLGVELKSDKIKNTNTYKRLLELKHPSDTREYLNDLQCALQQLELLKLSTECEKIKQEITRLNKKFPKD